MVLRVVRHRVWSCLTVSWRCRTNTRRIKNTVFLHSSALHWTNQVEQNFQTGAWSVLFFGTDEFALQSLKRLNDQYRLQKLLKRLEVVTAYKGQDNAVIRFAKDNGIAIHPWPLTISLSEFDIGLVVSFGHLIPEEIIKAFPLGMINVHASLLPKWRGAAPIIHALLNGDSHTGITIMKIMPDKFDIGDILAQEITDIHPDETMPELYSKLSNIGGDLLIKIIKRLPNVLYEGEKQTDTEATYARKVTAKTATIKWESMSAKNVYDMQRAFTGLHPLTTTFQDKIIKVHKIQVCDEPPKVANLPQNQPGYVIYDKKRSLLMVQCKGNSWVSIDEVIIPGRRRMSAKDFRNGFIANKKQTSTFFQ